MLTQEQLKAENYRDEELVNPNRAMRELTIGELLDKRIDKAKKLAHTLEDLKCSLPLSYLNSGASRITSIIEL